MDKQEKQKEIHFYFCMPEVEIWDEMCVYPCDIIHCLSKHEPIIHATVYHYCTTLLFEWGYRIFIHPYKGETFELTLGACANTDREIRIGHNLEKMLFSGVFDTEDTDVIGDD